MQDISKRPLNQRRIFWLMLLAVVILCYLIQQYGSYFFINHKGSSQLVALAMAQHKDVPVTLPGLGVVTPTSTVTVKTQINGQLLRVLFREGQLVKAGDLLAEIDPRPYEAQLVEYEGQLERDRALLANAETDLKRYQTLWRQDSVSKQILDTQVSLVEQDRGTVKLDEGLIATTKVNLIYCRITSPIDGRIGLRLVDPGNFVQTTDTSGIAVIDALDPITVIFPLPEDNIPQVVKPVNAGKTLVVEAYDRQQNKLLATGTLLTMDNQIDPTTGTVKLRAQFSNADSSLFPNQFVNIKIVVDTLLNATIVPTAAIQYGVQNTFVYVLNADNTVSVKPVVTGVTLGDDTTISSGVSPGQSVVVDGADKLTDGALVKVAGAIPSSTVQAMATIYKRMFA